MARRGVARQGEARQAWRGEAWRGTAGHVLARRGMSWRGMAGRARQARGGEKRVTISEKALLERIRHTAQLHRWRCYHTHDSRRSEPGFPDLVLVRGDRLIFAELKTDTGRITPAQLAWLTALEQCPGVQAHVWRPRDWPQVLRTLQQPRGRT